MFGAKKRLKKIVDDSFGKNPLDGYLYYNAQQRLNNVKRLHSAVSGIVDGEWKVDDITWDDLEMDQVFLRINHTNSFIGEQTLYHKLHLLDKGTAPEKIDRLEQRLACLKENPEARLDIETQMNYIGKHDEGYYLPEFLLNTDMWKFGNTLLYHVLQVLLIIGFVGCTVFNNIISIAGLVCIALINLMIYLFSKQKYEVYFNSLADFKRIYDFAKWMEVKDREHNIFVADDVRNSIHRLRRMSRVIFGMNERRQASMTGDVVAILREYIWGILLIDVSTFNHIMRIIDDKQENVLLLLDFVGEIDSDISILSYRESVSEWCKPEFVQNEFTVEGIAHPLIKNPVRNDFKLLNRAIITGANASGKSTFMKAIAINCIMAQTINTCMAKIVILQPMQIITCMSLRDDILTGESYYFREAKYLKRMLDVIEKDASALIVVDEILKGTNTKERVAASKAILDYIGNANCLALVATHDQELTKSRFYEDYHFRSKIQEKDIVFDYIIYKGTSEESNAIALLSYMGYPETIVKDAEVNMNANR